MAAPFPKIEDTLPHDHPMILLDRILSVDGERTLCEAVIREGAAFVEPEGLRTHVTLEHMAQCVAAGAGVRSLRDGEPPRVGFLVGCRTMQIHRPWLAIGSTVRVAVDNSWGEDHFGHFAGEVHVGEELVASATLSVIRLARGQKPSDVY